MLPTTRTRAHRAAQRSVSLRAQLSRRSRSRSSARPVPRPSPSSARASIARERSKRARETLATESSRAIVARAVAGVRARASSVDRHESPKALVDRDDDDDDDETTTTTTTRSTTTTTRRRRRRGRRRRRRARERDDFRARRRTSRDGRSYLCASDASRRGGPDRAREGRGRGRSTRCPIFYDIFIKQSIVVFGVLYEMARDDRM